MIDLFEKRLSNFLCKWKFELERTFVGRRLLVTDFFERLGSTIFILFGNIFKRRNYDCNCFNELCILNRDNYLPQVFVLSASDSSGNYFVDELYRGYLKIGQFSDPSFSNLPIIDLRIFLQENSVFRDYNDFYGALESELDSLTIRARTLTKGVLDDYKFPMIITKFTHINYLVSAVNLNAENLRTHCGVDNSQVMLYLLNKYIKKWHEEGLPIISFFIDSTDNIFSNERERNYTQDNFSDTRNLFKSWYKYIYRIFFDDQSYFEEEQQILLFKYLIGVKYKFSKETTDHLMKLVFNNTFRMIEKLSNKDISLLIDEIELERMEDIINNNSNKDSCIISSGNFIAIIYDNDSNIDFFGVFLKYMTTSLERINPTDNSPSVTSLLKTKNSYIGESCGLGNIFGCDDILNRVLMYTLPYLGIYNNINLISMNSRNSLSGIIVSGHHGCGKSSLVCSISREIKFDTLVLYSADIYNATIGHLELFLMRIIDFSIRRREVVIVFEELDQYFSEKNSTYTSIMFFIDLVSRSNKWCNTKILIFGTFGELKREVFLEILQPYRFFEHFELPGIGEWTLESITDILNIQLIPMLTRFLIRNSISFDKTDINGLIKEFSLLLIQNFTPALASGLASFLGMFLVKKSLYFLDNPDVENNAEKYFIQFTGDIINLVKQCEYKMPKSRDNCLLFERNVSDEFLIKLNSLCHTSSVTFIQAILLKLMT
ncbi:hypothetical protein FG386_003561 [Cryptosporidium ryanae]|uniref:uncharacterized protein n=1 Tax=Cryptosporidium ryanae TaxID=515981 RepID=UPI003519FC30|nr:hypothetical protein FG386_003561 [Cryptosporidium ryanae]